MNRFLPCGAGLLIGLAFAPLLRSHDPITTKLTWTQEVSRIVYKRCAECHHAGGPAFSLITYEEARPWAKAIRDEVLTRRMPPWGAVKGIGDFANDPSLSQPEIEMLVTWVEGGAPEGDPAYLPQYVPVRHAAVRRVAISPVEIRHELTLHRTARLLSIAPKDLAGGGEIEAWAVRPDQSIERLIWIRDYQTRFPRTYFLNQPLTLTAGTRLRVAGNGSLAFYLQ